MENIAINIQNVKKSFKVYNDKGNTLKERLIFLRAEMHILDMKFLKVFLLK